MIIEWMKNKRNVHVTVDSDFPYHEVLWHMRPPPAISVCEPTTDAEVQTEISPLICLTTLQVEWCPEEGTNQTYCRVHATTPYSLRKYLIFTGAVNYFEGQLKEYIVQDFNKKLREVLDGSV